jgi:hypothetical protein
MSSEIRRLEITYTTADTDKQHARGLSVWEQMSHDEISEDLAGALNQALKTWYARVGHRYLACEPEGFA